MQSVSRNRGSPCLQYCPPAEVAADVAGLRAALLATVPVRVRDRRPMVVTRNLRLSGT